MIFKHLECFTWRAFCADTQHLPERWTKRRTVPCDGHGSPEELVPAGERHGRTPCHRRLGRVGAQRGANAPGERGQEGSCVDSRSGEGLAGDLWLGAGVVWGVEGVKDSGCGEDGLSGGIRFSTAGWPGHRGRVPGGVTCQHCCLGPESAHLRGHRPICSYGLTPW